MQTATFAAIRALIVTALRQGYVLLISGYNNESGADLNNELAAEIMLDHNKFAPYIIPAKGFWDGTAEHSLCVIFRRAYPQTLPDLQQAIRALLRKYGQTAAILAAQGEFYIVRQSAAQDSKFGNTYNERFNEADKLGYTIAYLGEDRQPSNELFRFTIENKL